MEVVEVVEVESDSAARQKRAGKKKERQPAEGVHSPRPAAVGNQDVPQDMELVEQPIEVDAARRPLAWEVCPARS